MAQGAVEYRCKNRHFNPCLLIVGRLIFNYLHSNKTVCFNIQASSNLPKSPVAKNIFDNVPAQRKNQSDRKNLFREAKIKSQLIF